MSISISQTDNVGLTVESDPLALKLTGGTLSGKVNTVATTTANAGLSIPVGPAPTVPVDGDFWMSSIGPVVRLAGVTLNIPTAGLNNTFTGVNTFTSTLNYSGSNSNYGSATGASAIGISVGATTNGSTKAVNIGTNGLAGSFTNITVGSTTGTSTTTLQGITNGVTQAVGDNTTALATTAFVTAAVPAFATDAQAQTGSSTTLAMSPSAVAYAIGSCSNFLIPANAWAVATSGTGAVSQQSFYTWRVNSPTTAIGYGNAGLNFGGHTRATTGGSSGISNPFNWSKRFVGRFRFTFNTSPTDSNAVFRLCWGKSSNATTGDLAIRGVAIKRIASGAIILQSHDGTTLTSTTSSFTPTINLWYDATIVSDGTGNVSLSINDSVVASNSGGATTASGTNCNSVTIEAQNLDIITGSNAHAYVSQVSFEFSII